MIADDEMIMISALQHYLFCRRQCALIHVEGAWSENYLTVTGRQLHERVDRVGGETRKDVHLATALRLVSTRLGITGVADMVEFRRVENETENGVRVAAKLAWRTGWWCPFPVEYKRGRPKEHRADEVQLCAQALCLEEMLAVSVPSGALFYGETRRRVDVCFDEELRRLTHVAIRNVRELISSGVTPPPEETKGCTSCSLFELCRPEEMRHGRSAAKWLDQTMTGALA